MQPTRSTDQGDFKWQPRVVNTYTHQHASLESPFASQSGQVSASSPGLQPNDLHDRCTPFSVHLLACRGPHIADTQRTDSNSKAAAPAACASEGCLLYHVRRLTCLAHSHQPLEEGPPKTAKPLTSLNKPVLHKPGSFKRPAAKATAVTAEVNPEDRPWRYYNCSYCVDSNKKHKKWLGVAVLCN